MSLVGSVRRIVGVETGEGRLVGLCFLLSVLTGIPRVFIVTAANALFLEHFEASLLPAIYVATAALVPLAGAAYLRISRRLSFLATQIVVTGSLVGIHALLWLTLKATDASWVRVAAIIMVDVEWVMGVVVFWGIAGQLMTVRQAKRLYGLVGSGEIVAMTVGGACMPALVGLFGTTNVLLGATIGKAACVVGLLLLKRELSAAAQEESVQAGGPGKRRGIVGFLKDPYARIPLLTKALAAFAYYFADACFYRVAQDAMPTADQLTGFLGRFFAVISICALVGKTVIAPRWFNRFGVGNTLYVTPVSMALMAGLALLGLGLGVDAATIFWLVTVLKFVERVVFDSLGRPAYTALFHPMSAAERSDAQAAAETQSAQFATGLSGVMLLAMLSWLDLGLGVVLASLSLPLAGWLWIAYRGARAYPEKLSESLRDRGLSGLDLQLDDAATIQLLEAQVRSGDSGSAAYSLSLLAQADHPRLGELLLELTGHRDPEVARVAFEHLQSRPVPDRLDTLLDRLREAREPEVIAAALGAAGASGHVEALDALLAFVDHEDALVRRAALASTIRDCGIPGAVRGGSVLLDLESSPHAEERALAAGVIGDVGVANFYTEIIPLLDDENRRVQEAAIEAAGKLGAPHVWPRVILSLQEQELRHAAVRALARGGDQVLAAMAAVPADRDHAVWPHLVAVAGKLGTPEATRFLLERLGSVAGPEDQAILQALYLCRYAAAGEWRERFEDRVHAEVGNAVTFMQALTDIGKSASTGLRKAVELELFRTRERIFLSLAFLHSPQRVMKVWSNWREGSVAHRAFAVELLESVLPHGQMALLTPLLEALDPGECLSRLSGRFPHEALEPGERLLEIASGKGAWTSAWTRASALAAAGAAGIPEARSLAAAVRRGAPSLLARVAQEEYEAEEAGGARPGVSLATRVGLLEAAPIFARVPVDLLAEIAMGLDEVDLAKNEPLFHAGDAGTAMYVVASGKVRIHLGDRLLSELGPGQILGELAAIDPEPRSASVTAAEDTVLFPLGQDRLSELVGEYMDVATGIIHVLCERLQSALADSGDHPPEAQAGSAPILHNQDTLSLVEKVVFLKSAELFHDTPTRVATEAAALMKEVLLPKGERLFGLGQLGSTMYVIVRGRILVHRGDQEIAQLGAQAILGEMAPLSSAPRSASATALEETVLLELGRESLLEIMYSQPDVSRSIMRTLVKRLRATRGAP